MYVDWKQPYIFLFEWGLYLLGWMLVTLIGLFFLSILYATVRATVVTLTGKSQKKENPTKVSRDIVGRFSIK
jgi:hypothetical protein